MSEKIVVGRLGKSHGVHGWLRVQSFTEPPLTLFEYPHWFIKSPDGWQSIITTHREEKGDLMLVKLEGFDSPEAARLLANCEIAVESTALPPLEEGEYYWRDLQQLQVVDMQGQILGTVDHLFRTGSNDIIVVQDEGGKEILIPYLDHVVTKIDLKKRVIIVDWDPNF